MEKTSEARHHSDSSTGCDTAVLSAQPTRRHADRGAARYFVEQVAGRLQGRRLLQSRLQGVITAEPLHVPRVELAQVARGALGAEVLARAFEHPVELGHDLLPIGLALASAEQLLEQPRVAERPARQ